MVASNFTYSLALKALHFAIPVLDGALISGWKRHFIQKCNQQKLPRLKKKQINQ